MPPTWERMYSKIVTESNDEEFVDVGPSYGCNILGHLILISVFGKGFF